ncbi:hypothetical protein [Ferdinandcohnia sp. Marseille-Q9671]
MTGLVAVVMVFSIPLVAIITDHFQKQSKYKQKLIQEELELERLKHENYLLETEKMRAELELMKLEAPKDERKVL